MKAIVLAAGFGTRLQPITFHTPKCLVEIKNKPLLELWLDKIVDLGVNEILINTHYLSEKVVQFISNYFHANKCKIVYEDVLLGTAGTLISNLDFFEDEDCLFVHADNYCEDNLIQLINTFLERDSGIEMTMMTFTTNKPEECGIVEINQNGIVEKFYEKVYNPPTSIANSAVYVISNSMLKNISLSYNNAYNFSTDIIPFFLKKISTYHTEKNFADIGTLDEYEKYK